MSDGRSYTGRASAGKRAFVEARPSARPPAAAATGIQCLVVDDQPTLLSALLGSLRALGHQCIEASSGRQALALLESTDIDVVISDVRMPEMDGVELLERVRRAYPDVAVIMVTGMADVETAVGCLRRGAYDYIVKPFQLDEIHARVLQAAEKRRLVLENQRYQHHLTELVQQQALRIEELFLEGIQSIVHALEAKDPYTQGHSTRVAAYAGAVARRLGFEEDDVQLVELGAELHDVGKIGVSEAILNKRGALSEEEYRHIMQHTVIGARIMAPLLRNVPAVLGVVRSHHERMDGRGLPDGLAGERIPLNARLVSVVDAFDAMTTGRSYRPGMGPDTALRELSVNSGAQFDQRIVTTFVAAYPEIGILPIATPRRAWRRLPRRLVGAGIAVPAGV